MIDTIWRKAKLSRKVTLGPVSVIYRVSRTVTVSSNTRRRLVRLLHSSLADFLNTTNGHINMTDIVKENTHRESQLDSNETALVVGVGAGFGFGVARKLVASGMNVALASRNAERLDPLVNELGNITNRTVRAYGCDATDERSVKALMSNIIREMGVPQLVVYSVQGSGSGQSVDIEVPAFEECWRQNCLGGFIVAREAARRMAPLRRGTIVLVGSTSGIIGRAGHITLAVGKFGLRAIAQVMARELWPSQVHVVHLIIDADIREEQAIESNDPEALPEHISDLVYTLHRQPRSAWTSEIDIRPWNEKFWEHC